MTKYQPATAATDALVRPPCTKCGTRTLLVGIEAEKPGFDLNTFECPKCGQHKTTVTRIGAAS
jgi:predicted nucleic-acid-binding Zn-ribbon protein